MTMYGNLPFLFQSLISFIGGTLFLIYVFKVKSYNRIGMVSFAVYGYGISFISLLSHFHLNRIFIILLFKWLHIFFIIGLIVGIFISYKLGPKEQKGKVLELLKQLATIFLFVIVGVSILILIGAVKDL